MTSSRVGIVANVTNVNYATLQSPYIFNIFHLAHNNLLTFVDLIERVDSLFNSRLKVPRG